MHYVCSLRSALRWPWCALRTGGIIPKYGFSYLDYTRMSPGNLHKFRKSFGFMDEIDGYDGKMTHIRETLLAHASGSRQCRHGSAVLGSEVTSRMQPDQSRKRQRRPTRGGLARRSGSPLLVTGPRLGNGDAAVADASGSDVRDRPQDWLSGIGSGSHPEVGDSDRGTGFQPVSPGSRNGDA